ncbi:MAG: hypothetical protein ACODAA_08780, partial [Gemmatimonadota bacterium]
EQLEERLAEIDATFADPEFYDETPLEDVRGLEEERARLQSELENRLAEWESLETELAGVG